MSQTVMKIWFFIFEKFILLLFSTDMIKTISYWNSNLIVYMCVRARACVLGVGL